MSFKNNRQESVCNRNLTSFKVGDGAHYGWNGDAYPLTVVKISDSGRDVYCSTDGYYLTDGKGANVEGPRDCVFTSLANPSDDQLMCFKLRKHGRFSRSPGPNAFDELRAGRVYARNPSL